MATVETDEPDGARVNMSPNVERALLWPRPSWRGRMHRWAAIASIPAGILLVATAGDAWPWALQFALGTTIMFGTSAVVHYRRWSVSVYERMFQADHTAIFLMFCGSVGPIAGAIGGTAGWVLFSIIYVGAALAITVVWLPFHPPRGLMNTLFLTLGWTSVIMVPWMFDALGVGGTAFLIAGGVVYTVGAVIVGLRRPDPDPNVFGYHEIWHVFVIVAVALHYVMIAGYALPAIGS